MPSKYPAIMVVAHPDDEMLFGGAFLITHPGTLVLCMTRGDDADRRPEFEAAMRAVRADYQMFSFEDIAEHPWSAMMVHERLRPYLRRPAQYIITHSSDGEYGHPHHRQLHGVVRSFTDNLWCFSKGPKIHHNYIETKKRILGFYKTQTGAVDSLTDWIEGERIAHVLDPSRVIELPPVTE